MQIFAMCMECQKELGHPSFESFFVPYYDDRIAYVECSRGHKSALLIQSPKFEVLMESGANALAAGFTLEAVASFSAALERFYEFCLKVISVHRKMSQVTIDEMAKAMSSQSERQLGAFLAFYALEFGEAYQLNQKLTTFRNSVIHKGKIPTPDEAKEFCERVYGEIIQLTEKLKIDCAEEIKDVTFNDLTLRSKQLPVTMPRATSTGCMFYSALQNDSPKTFSEALEKYLDSTSRLSKASPWLKILSALFTKK